MAYQTEKAKRERLYDDVKSMRRLVTYIALFIITVFLNGCSKSNNSAGPVVITASVNGTQWGASVTNVTFNKTPTLHITIHAVSGSTSMNFDLNPYTGIGIYPITSSNGAYYAVDNGSSGVVYNQANSGQVEITDTYSDGGTRTFIKGKFSFSTDNNIAVTNGLFTVYLELN